MTFNMTKFANTLLHTTAKAQAGTLGRVCEDCELEGQPTPATQEWDARYMGSGGRFLCEKHASQHQDAWTEDHG